MNVIIGLLLGVSLTALPGITFSQQNSSEAEGKTQEEASEAVYIPLSELTLTDADLKADFYFTEIGFYSSRRHWDNPSTFTMNSDGTWFFFATRLANFDKTWGDTGRTWRVRVDVKYYTIYDASTKKCAGQLLHANRYPFATVRYKQQKHNFTRRGDDAEYAKISGTARCASLISWWYN